MSGRVTVRVVRFRSSSKLSKREIEHLRQGVHTDAFPALVLDDEAIFEDEDIDVNVTDEGLAVRFDGPLMGPTEILADIEVVFHDYDSKNAELDVLLDRYKDVPYPIDGPVREKYTRRYVAFWQAWSVPMCDDVRRVVYGFLVTRE